MRTIVVDGAASQRRILTLLIETELAASPDACETPESAGGPFDADDRVFLDAAFSPAPFLPATVIATGAAKQDALLADRIREGAAAFLLKPYTRDGLHRALRDAELSKAAA